MMINITTCIGAPLAGFISDWLNDHPFAASHQEFVVFHNFYI